MRLSSESNSVGSIKTQARRRRVAAILVGFALLGGTVVLGQSASAANNCTTGNVCLYDYDNFSGLLASRAGGGGVQNLAATLRDKTAAWGNDSPYDGALYTSLDGAGACFEMDSLSTDYFNIDRRDRTESWRTNTGC